MVTPSVIRRSRMRRRRMAATAASCLRSLTWRPSTGSGATTASIRPPALAPGARRARLLERVARAEPLALLDEKDAVPRGGAHVGGVRSDDDDGAVGHGPCRPEGVGDQRATAEWVEHLGLSRAHPFRFSGGENDGGQLAHGLLTCALYLNNTCARGLLFEIRRGSSKRRGVGRLRHAWCG